MNLSQATHIKVCGWKLRTRTSGIGVIDMTKLLDRAIEAARKLSQEEQDEIARAILILAGSDDAEIAPLTEEERSAIERSKAAALRGEFASDKQVAAVWAKYGL